MYIFKFIKKVTDDSVSKLFNIFNGFFKLFYTSLIFVIFLLAGPNFHTKYTLLSQHI